MKRIFSRAGLILLMGSSTALAGAPANTPQLVEHGKAVFMNTCMVCHGAGGKGDGPAGVTMNPRPRNFTADKFKNGTRPEDIFNTVTNGLTGTAMASFATLPERDRWALAYYVESLRKSGKK